MSDTLQKEVKFPVSHMAENLIGSEIIKLGNEVSERIKNGEKVFNFTIGDFDPFIFPIPQELEDEIITAYKNHLTNYPMANGMPDLRAAVSSWNKRLYNLDYSPAEVLIAGGARPIIYAIYNTILDKGDKVIYPIPSWNNNHYCHLLGAEGIQVICTHENNFMPTATEILPHVKGATLLALCSPQNPTGTVFTKNQLEEICDCVLEENARRGENEKPLYVMYDQIYGALLYGENKHVDPVSLRPEMRPFTIYVDGISKSFAATGVRVGWAMGPAFLMDKMKAILSHIGAWSPKPEQMATAKFLENEKAVEEYLVDFKSEIHQRLQSLYQGFCELKKEGFAVQCIEPRGAIYLTLQFDLVGKKTEDGNLLKTNQEVASYLLDKAKLAIVPFTAFGADQDNSWYRLSVGTCKTEGIPEVLSLLRSALSALN